MPDDQYREDAIKAVHLLLRHRTNTDIEPLNEDLLREKAEQFVDAAVMTGTTRLVMLTVGSEASAEMLAVAVRQCDGPGVEPTPQDIAEAHHVIARIATPLRS